MLDKVPTEETRWRQAFAGCLPTLKALAGATNLQGRMTARSWWVICMADSLDECNSTLRKWKAEAAGAGIPDHLTTQHTYDAVSLPGFEKLARCVTKRGEAAGVDSKALLHHIEMGIDHHPSAGVWSQAVAEAEPLRASLMQSFLMRGDQERRASANGRPFYSNGDREDVVLAASAGEMGVDELLLCQVWMYGLASRLGACQRSASAFAGAADMSDPNHPLENYNQKLWVPPLPPTNTPFFLHPSSSQHTLGRHCCRIRRRPSGWKWRRVFISTRGRLGPPQMPRGADPLPKRLDRTGHPTDVTPLTAVQPSLRCHDAPV